MFKTLSLPRPGHLGIKTNPVTPAGQVASDLDIIAVNEPETFTISTVC
jgi:hypothetical protein